MKPIENSKNSSDNKLINLSSLPPEILLRCFSFLNSPKNLVSLSKTNHSLRYAALDSSLWRSHKNHLTNPKINKYIIENNENYPEYHKFKGFAELSNGFLAVGLSDSIQILDTIHFKTIKVLKARCVWSLVALPDNQLAVAYKSDYDRIKIYSINARFEEENTSNSKNNWCNQVLAEVKINILYDCCDPFDFYICDRIKILTTLPNGKLAGGGCCTGSIEIWDTRSGNRLMKLQAHNSPVLALAALPNEKLASVSQNQPTRYEPIRIWDLKSGQCVKIFDQDIHYFGVYYTLMPMPDGCLAFAVYDKAIRIWNIESGDVINDLPIEALSIAMLPHGQLVTYSVEKSNSIYFWDIHQNKYIKKINFGSQKIPKSWSSRIICLKSGKLICGRGGDGLYVFNFPSVPENLLEQPDEKIKFKLT